MMRVLRWTVLFPLLAGCAAGPSAKEGAADSSLFAAREARLDTLLHDTVTAKQSDPIALWKLPPLLNEISGLALTSHGRLLTHGDELAQIVELDYRQGRVLKAFTLGSPPIHGDFESITRAGETIFLFTSKGVLYRFREGTDKSSVPFAKFDTGLGSKCEFEGMAYDSTANQLLFACKHTHEKELKGSVVIYRTPLGADGGIEGQVPVPLMIPMAEAVGENDWNGFHPSDITIDPMTGNYVLLASLEKAIMEVTPAGEVIFSRPLPPNHAQPEGIAITADHILIISDEAHGGQARITLHRWP
ncbi:MAG: hypothetical protein ABJC19_05630 [Gemmatimonadota bacterium]